MSKITEKDVIQGIWSFGKHQKQIELEEKRLQQKQKELDMFVRSGGQQVELFNKQLSLMDKQTTIQGMQTKILNRTFWIYVVLAIITLLNTIIILFK
jgi:hypothetical protein